MSPSEAFRQYLEEHFRTQLPGEAACTCGHANHACIRFFRVDGKPAAVVTPETRAVNAADLAEALGGGRVEPTDWFELEAPFLEGTTGRPRVHEVLSRAAVYVDESLGSEQELVFCPRMFLGQARQCFHVPAQKFFDLTRACFLPLTSASVLASDDWAV